MPSSELSVLLRSQTMYVTKLCAECEAGARVENLATAKQKVYY